MTKNKVEALAVKMGTSRADKIVAPMKNEILRLMDENARLVKENKGLKRKLAKVQK